MPRAREDAAVLLLLLIAIVEAIRAANIQAKTQDARAAWEEYNRERPGLLRWRERNERN